MSIAVTFAAVAVESITHMGCRHLFGQPRLISAVAFSPLGLHMATYYKSKYLYQHSQTFDHYTFPHARKIVKLYTGD